MDRETFSEMQKVITDVETRLRANFQYDKINYFMLMMVDPVVHYHVIPRYSRSIEMFGKCYGDACWPAIPEFSKKDKSELNELRRIKEKIIGP